jgi:hypothetical protein
MWRNPALTATGRLTRTFFLLGPKNQRFFTPFGYLPTVIFLSQIFLTLFIGGSAIATSRFLCLSAEVSKSRDPISLVNADFPRRFGTSCYRDSCTISSGSRVPRPKVPRCRLLDLSPFVGSLLTRLTPELVNLRGLMYRGHYSLQPTLIHAMHMISATSALALTRLFRPTHPVRPAKYRYARYPSRTMISEVLVIHIFGYRNDDMIMT